MSVSSAPGDLAWEFPAPLLGETTVLGRGGAGTVEAIEPDRLPIRGPLVFKRFHSDVSIDQGALRASVAWRLNLEAPIRARLDGLAAWPLALVTEGGQAVGFVMHRVPDQFVHTFALPSGAEHTGLREAQYLLAGDERAERLGLEDVTDISRMEVVWALAEAVDFFHAQRVVLGDISSRNVLWRADPGAVLFVDCDSFSLAGTGSAVAPMATVDWEDPAQSDLAASADVYKLGLFAVRSLGRSFQSTDPAIAHDRLEAAGRRLVTASLSHVPAERPRASDWAEWARGCRRTRADERQRSTTAARPPGGARVRGGDA